MDVSLLIIIAVALFIVYAILQYNKLVRLNIQVDEAFAQIEVQLKRRADLILISLRQLRDTPPTKKKLSRK